ncbi:MAG: M20/M25/M40 family metallo-hydrolase [Pyrinomonadaceae bacterium]|nr:M20/M25/M40 family metallo-hydrolase [Pyrinomonadaceae bacterium]
MRQRSTAALLLLCLYLSSTLTLNAQQPTASPNASAQNSQAQNTATDQNDPVARIKDEGLNRSQVMQTLQHLTDVIGPRLTASPQMKLANTWTRDKLTEWGLQNAHLEAWGPFGRGWTLQRFNAQVVAPQNIPLVAYPKAWSPGTNGVLTGDVVYVDAKDENDLQRFKGKLRGAIVLTSPPRELKARFEPLGTRLTEKELLELADAPDPAQRPTARRPTPEQLAQFQAIQKFAAARLQFFTDEGAALLVDPSRGGDGGTLFVQSASVAQPFDVPRDKRTSAWDKNAKVISQIVVASEHYNRMTRMIGAGEKLRMAVDIAVQFNDDDPMGYNTVAEIPGTDLKDELVMLGGHMDSWHAGTGATDNAAGVAVSMEAVRILKTLNLQPRRTIRIALWSGEEQGLFGSRAYVAEHFGTLVTNPTTAPGATAQSTLQKKPDYEKLSAYFNLDNGTGRIRGVYLQGNEAVRPLFRQWLAPFREMGAQTLTISNTGGTDHLSFDAIGLPGFQFIQDEIEYDTRTHHSNQDVYDRIQADDMKQAAVIMAAFIYNTAMRDERLPRKPQRAN